MTAAMISTAHYVNTARAAHAMTWLNGAETIDSSFMTPSDAAEARHASVFLDTRRSAAHADV